MTHKRYIIHIDMDAFYASVEQLDNPELRGKPIIVGSMGRGVVTTASYEARTFGVRSAMPSFIAKQKCPHAIFVPPNMARYAEISKNIHHALHNFSPLVEMASIDEAYLDITGMENIFGTPLEIAHRIKDKIQEITGGLTCSIGIAPIKFLAKIASDENKPNGIFMIEHDEIHDYLNQLPLAKIPGVGKKFEAKLNSFGITKCADVIQLSKEFLESNFGKSGLELFERAHGIDTREIIPYTAKKSESAENTLDENTKDKTILQKWLMIHAERVGASLRKDQLKAKTITLKVKFADFTQVTRQTSLKIPSNSTDCIFQTASSLLDTLTLNQSVRLIGLGASGFDNHAISQLSLLGDTNSDSTMNKQANLDNALDSLREKYGKRSIIRGRTITK